MKVDGNRLSTGEGTALHYTPRDRHCYGHAAFSADGGLLYTTENAIERGEGRIGIWDTADGYRRLGEMPSHGIGPHESPTAAASPPGIRPEPFSSPAAPAPCTATTADAA